MEDDVKLLDSNQELVSCREAAEILGVPKTRVLGWASKGLLGELSKVSTGRGGRPQFMIPKERLAAAPKPVLHGGAVLTVDETPAQLPNDAMLTRQEALELTGWHPTHLGKLTREGKLDFVEVPGVGARATRLWYRNSIEAYLAGRRTHHVNPVGVLPTAMEVLEKLEASVRELKYALIREEKGRKKELAARLQRLLED